MIRKYMNSLNIKTASASLEAGPYSSGQLPLTYNSLILPSYIMWGNSLQPSDLPFGQITTSLYRPLLNLRNLTEPVIEKG